MIRHIILLLVFTVTTVASASELTEQQQRVETLMQVSGLTAVLGGLSANLENTPLESNSGDTLERQKFARVFKQVIKETFQASRLVPGIRDHAARELSDAEITFVTDFYASEFGQKIVALETASNDPQTQAAIHANVAGILQQMEQDTERKALIEAMLEALSALEQTEAMVRSMTYSMLAGMVGAGQIPQALSDEQLEAITDQQMAASRPQILNAVLATTYTSYQALSIADLRAYLAFLSDARAKQAYRVLYEAMSAAFAEEATRFGHELLVRMGMRDA